MKLVRLFAGMVLSLALLTGTGCGSGSSEKCETVNDVPCKGGSKIKACCTNSDCKYVLDGKDYPCNGTDCSSAAETVVGICM